MIIEKASGFSEINLGRQGENQARKVVFDVLRAWREEFGSTGAASLIVQRSEDTAPYPVTLGEENGMLTWTVGAADTAYAGEGKAELRYTVGSTVVKSCIYKTVVRATLGDGTSEPPEAYQSWVDEVLTAAAGVETAVNKMPYIDTDTGNWFKWDAKSNAFADTGVSAQGPKGDTGPAGASGAKGDPGPKGDPGEKGEKGDTGATGAAGAKGETGATGPAGANGRDGAPGPKGETGPAGPKGDPGEKGDPFTYADFTAAQLAALKGEKGDKGDKGDTGATGPQGEKGEPGPIGQTGPQGPVGLRGPQGETGRDFRVLGYYGTKNALDAAQKATALAGDAYGVGAAEPYDIYIFDGVTGEFVNNGPLQGAKGDKGDTGDTGPRGETGPAGPAGPKGEPGADGATGPKGEPGADGADGKTPVKGVDYFTPTDVNEIAAEAAKKVDISSKLDKPANNTTATVGQLLTKTTDGQEWKDREKDVFIVKITGNTDSGFTADKTFAEITKAYNAGSICMASYFSESLILANVSPLNLLFSRTAPASPSSINGFYISYDSDGIIVISDITTAETITAAGLLKGDGGGDISSATAGTDYVAPNGDSSTLTAAFTTATTRANIATGEKLSVLFGKIAKWFTDLGSLAFKSTVSKSDLAEDVQTSLDKADSALQSAPNTTSLIKGDGSGGLAAATRGSDYIASGNIVKQTLVSTETTPTENYAINWYFK